MGYDFAFDIQSGKFQALDKLGGVQHEFDDLYKVIEFTDNMKVGAGNRP